MNSINQNSASIQLSRPIWPGLIIALIIAVSLSGTADHDLWTPDEPREAAIALSMSKTGNLIIPELAGQPFVEKPPLFYIVASFFLLGLGKIIGNTAALRLVSACFGLFTLLFTYQLGKIYFDRQKALIAAAILATMIGFIHVTHWLLVDNALMFFIAASIWALAKVYENNRLSYLPLAGILAAGAFLTKGLIGPLIIGLAWLGIFIPWVNERRASACQRPSDSEKTARRQAAALPKIRILTIHLISLGIALLISIAWVIAFAVKGGPELFREWWWTNHFGRFTGTADHLGHISSWYYYFGVLPVYILPWLAPFIIALVVLFKKLLRVEPIPAGGALLVMWILGALALLSLAATKREIYLSVLLPACALLCVYGLDLSSPTGAGYASLLRRSKALLRRSKALGYEGRAAEVSKQFYRVWLFLLLIILAAFVLAPLVGNEFFGLSFTFGWRQILALATVLISALTLSRITAPFLQRFLIVTMMCYSTLFIIICPIVDRHKSYGPAFRAAADAISAHPQLKIAGWNLDETTMAGFYYYCNLAFPFISDEQMLGDVLHGQNTNFNGVLTLVKNASSNDLPDGRNQVIFESRMGKRRLLQLLAAPDWEKKCRMKNEECL